MKLFLTSTIKHPKSIEELKKFAGNLQNMKVLYIPTAANGEGFGSWKSGESLKVAHKLSNCINIVQLEDFHSINIKQETKKSDIIWIAGGMSGYLMYWIRRTGFDEILNGELKKEKIYVGSSAGSMICAKTLFSAEWCFGDEEPGASLISGLGLIDFEIYPHYDDSLFSKINKKWKKGKICLLKDGETIIVNNNEVKIIGEKRFIEK